MHVESPRQIMKVGDMICVADFMICVRDKVADFAAKSA